MLILGLLLLAATAAFTGLVISDNLSGGPDYSVSVVGNHIATMNSLAVFCAGLALALLFGLGVMMAGAGLGLRRRRSRKLHEARRDAADLARERDELAARPDRPAAEPEPEPDPDHTTAAGDLAANRGTASATDPGATTTAPRRRHARHLFGH